MIHEEAQSFTKKRPNSCVFVDHYLFAMALLLEVTQLPRERWHPAGSGSTTRRLDDSTTRLSSPKSELAEV